MSKKDQVITELFKLCQAKNNYIFHNDLVKDISKQFGVGNPFDVTKLDSKKSLPDILISNNYAIIHLGNGNHQFIKGIDIIYHEFEPIQEIIQWDYHKSLLNQYNSSESNILSVANNQRILHHFLFGKDTEFDDINIEQRPKTYFPHRTKTSFAYNFGRESHIELENIQIEIDLTIEFQGTVGVFEAKNGTPDNFAIYQLYHPFLYYYNANKLPEINGRIKQIYSVYVVKSIENKVTNLKMWAYMFTNSLDISSIQLIKSACYQLNP